MTDLIAELDRLFAKATPGEWKGVPIRLVINGQQGPLMSHQVGSTHSPEGLHVTAGSERVADHELIAALHNAYPALRDLLRSAEKGQAWVSVEERLPVDGVLVRIRARSGMEATASYFGGDWLWHDENLTGWILGKHVAHWQPLPPAPEEAPK